MPDVVQQDRQAQDLTKSRPTGGRELTPRLGKERIEHARRDVHRANAVRIARVCRSRKGLVREAELLDPAKALVDATVDDGQLSAGDRDAAVNGISDRNH
jgi:hypothetical protein